MQLYIETVHMYIETMRKLCLPTKFPHQEVGEITVFNVVRGSKITTWV